MSSLITVEQSSVSTVQQKLDEQWAILKSQPAARDHLKAELAAAGVDLDIDELLNQPSNPFEASAAREGSGTGIVETIAIKVAVSVGSALILKGLNVAWSKFIEPEIRDRFGRGGDER